MTTVTVCPAHCTDPYGFCRDFGECICRKPDTQAQAPAADKGPKPLTEAPATTAASCAKYKARSYRCDCPNRKGGGSYYDERLGERCCKHMANMRLGKIDEIVVKSIETGKTIAQLTAESAVRFEKATGKPADPRQALITEMKTYRVGSPMYDYAKKRLQTLNNQAAADLDMDSPQIRLILASARSTDANVKVAARLAADALGTSLAAIVRRADALAESQSKAA